MAPPINPLRRQRIAFQQQREQAQWRGEPWEITWEQWWALWQPLWPQRGRCRGELCMRRLDRLQPWHILNVEIVDRVRFLHEENVGKPKGARL